MTALPSVITIGIDPTIELGPISVAWHGLTIAIGDVINGEHYGPATDFFLGVRNTHPDALTPSPEIAYHSGGLYEVLLAAIVFVIAWPLRKRLTRPLALMWLVIALLAAGRFLQFFWRSDDSADLALGLETAQWTSLAILAVAAFGAWLTLAHRPAAASTPRVELLWWLGCPSWEEARQLVREEMAAAGLDPEELEVREVNTDEAAEREGFVGSPTIRVDGRDIQDPGAEPIGLSCRVYRLRDGRISALPDPADVRDALRRHHPRDSVTPSPMRREAER